MGDDNDGHKSQAGCLTTHDLSEQQGLRGKTYIQTNSFNSHQISRWKGHPWAAQHLHHNLLGCPDIVWGAAKNKTKQNTKFYLILKLTIWSFSHGKESSHCSLWASLILRVQKAASSSPSSSSCPSPTPPSDSFPSHLYCQGLKPAGISISGGSYCAVIKQQLIANRVLLCLGLMRGEKINLVTTN